VPKEVSYGITLIKIHFTGRRVSLILIITDMDVNDYRMCKYRGKAQPFASILAFLLGMKTQSAIKVFLYNE